MTSIAPGREILGKYRVDGLIGRGGMGEVLRAVHVELDTRVAIKVLHGVNVTMPDVASRFLREAQAASKLRSEFVARVTDYGRIEDGRPCMVMELLDGEDYQSVLSRGPLPITDAVDAIVQAAAALAEAHAAGIIHRDIKPSNLFRTSRPDGSSCTKVLDFGISKVVDALAHQPITETGNVLGTPLYMSPEQIRSPKEIDARTDVWSLGVVLYELLAGAPPFQSDTMGQVFARILETAPESIDVRRPEVPAALAEIVHRCLEKNRERRVASMRELAGLLAPFASAEGAVAARRAGVVAPPGEDLPRISVSPGNAPPGETSALAETLQAAAIASETPAAPAATGGPARTTLREGRTPGAASRTGRARWPIPLAAAGIAAIIGGIALVRMQGETPVRDAASPTTASAVSVEPAIADTAPAVTPAATATVTATAAPSPSGTASAAAAPATATAAPHTSATASAGPRKPIKTAPSSAPGSKPTPTTLW